MVNSPEQYLSNLTFSMPLLGDGDRGLTPSERIFVEKYLGMAELEQLQPQVQPALQSQTKPILPDVAPAPVIEVKKPAEPFPDIVVSSSVAPEEEMVVEAVATPIAQSPPLQTVEPAVENAVQPTLRDMMRQANEVQVVSFFVAGQLFLLPVSAIQEVLRHMELVKVPQAPDFVAGVINLRGRVTPLVHLAALITNAAPTYSDRNFIIICGSENLQLGLIIDKISSMHMLPQEKIIWNVEAKLGDGAEFLCALANLDDRVCGIVAPDMIVQKILSS